MSRRANSGCFAGALRVLALLVLAGIGGVLLWQYTRAHYLRERTRDSRAMYVHEDPQAGALTTDLRLGAARATAGEHWEAWRLQVLDFAGVQRVSGWLQVPAPPHPGPVLLAVCAVSEPVLPGSTAVPPGLAPGDWPQAHLWYRLAEAGDALPAQQAAILGAVEHLAALGREVAVESPVPLPPCEAWPSSAPQLRATLSSAAAGAVAGPCLGPALHWGAAPAEDYPLPPEGDTGQGYWLITPPGAEPLPGLHAWLSALRAAALPPPPSWTVEPGGAFVVTPPPADSAVEAALWQSLPGEAVPWARVPLLRSADGTYRGEVLARAAGPRRFFVELQLATSPPLTLTTPLFTRAAPAR